MVLLAEYKMASTHAGRKGCTIEAILIIPETCG